MAVAAGVLSDTRRRTLEAVCDTFAPQVEVDDQDPVLREFYARSASDMGIAPEIEGLMAQAMMPEEIEAFGELLDGLAEHDFASLPLEARTQVLHDVRDSGPEAKYGVQQM